MVPVAFQIAAQNPSNPERAVRLACRDSFRKTRLLEKIIPGIEDVLAAGGFTHPKPPEDALAPAIPETGGLGDVGHRN